MRVAEAEILVDAPTEVVWSVVADLDRYPEWNPFVVRVDVRDGGEPAVGSDLTLHVRWASGRGLRSHERITRLEPGRALEYEFAGPIPRLGMVRARRLQTLEPAGDGRTRYRSDESFSGWLVKLMPLGAVQDGFDRQAAALKVRAEALASRS